MKLQNRVVTPGGTITRTVFEARGLPIGKWVGTNDTGATSINPAGSGPPNNMVQVTGMVYDNGITGGDGNVTQQTDFVDASGTNDRVTAFLYDFRNRQTDVDGEIDFYAKQYFDNLSRVHKNERLNTTSGGNLIERSIAVWNDRGAVLQTSTFAVDPTTGIVGNALVANIWRDASQNVVKSLPAGSQLFTKTTFDSLSRNTAEHIGYGIDANYDAIFSLANNTVLEQTETTFDVASNAIQTTLRKRYDNAPASQFGDLGDPSVTPNARVSYAAMYPDALGRTLAVADYGTNSGTALSRPSTTPARSDTCLVTSMQFNAAGNVVSLTDPAAKLTCFSFDTVPREISRIINCTAATSSSSSSSGGCAPSADTNVTVLTAYNADGQIAAITAINPFTNDQVTQFVYETTLTNSAIASNLLKSSEILPDSISGSDRITWTYNRQGQKTSLSDQNGTVHSYDYDLLGRETDDRITMLGMGIDNAVLRVSGTYDVRGMRQNVTSYDNASVGSGSVVNDVQFAYNSFSQLLADYQSHSGAVNMSNTPRVQYAYADGSENTVRPTTITYPNGRKLNYGYSTAGGIADSASRIASIIDNDGTTRLADYSYLGASWRAGNSKSRMKSSLLTLASPFNPDTIVQVNSPQPGIQYTLVGIQGGNDPSTGDIYRGLDLFGRIKDLIWVQSGSSSSSSSTSSLGPGTNLVRIQHTYDRMANRLSRRDLVADSFGLHLDELYQYDLINRLKQLDRGTLNSGANAISSNQFTQCWSLDTTGNWFGFREDDNGDGFWDLVQSRSSNSVNEIIGIANAVGPVWAQPTYDAAGNTTTVPQPANPVLAYSTTYDAWNRIVKVVDVSNANTVAQYAYDGTKRRILKNVYTAGVLSETRHLFYTDPQSWQVLEERVGTSTHPERQFVWGLQYIDGLVLRDRDTTGTGTLNERLYSLQDANWNTAAVADNSATVQERYLFDAYGTPTFLTPLFVDRPSSVFASETLFAGYPYDTLTGFCSPRNRVYLPNTGAWLQRDTTLFHDALNLYEYVMGSPKVLTDPSGLFPPGTQAYENCVSDCYDQCGTQYPSWWQYTQYVGCIGGCNSGCAGSDSPVCYYLNNLPQCNNDFIQCLCGLIEILDIFMGANPYVFLADCLVCETITMVQTSCMPKNVGTNVAWGLTQILDCMQNSLQIAGVELIPIGSALISISVALMQEHLLSQLPNGVSSPAACCRFTDCLPGAGS